MVPGPEIGAGAPVTGALTDEQPQAQATAGSAQP